jgi:hypothetical protein
LLSCIYGFLFILQLLFVQKFTIALAASDYSALLSVGSNSTLANAVNSSTVVTVGGTSSASTTTLTKQLPMTYSYTAVQTCRSYGDPHIVTFDKLGYGFQIPGEWLPTSGCCCNSYVFLCAGDYYLVRSQSGDFVIQVRQFQCRAAACNKMAAIKWGSTVLFIDVDNRCEATMGPVYLFCRSFRSCLPPFQEQCESSLRDFECGVD